jgi:hypothetical protein
MPPPAGIELRVIDSPAEIAVTGLTAAQAEQIVVKRGSILRVGGAAAAQPLRRVVMGSFNLWTRCGNSLPASW